MGPASADEDTQTTTPRGAPLEEGAILPGSDAGSENVVARGGVAEDAAVAGGAAVVEGAREGTESGTQGEVALDPGARPSVGPASEAASLHRPSFVFFGIVAGVSLAADIASKVWAEWTLNQRGFEPLELIRDHLAITLAYNRGGAWGLFAGASDMVRKPFFLGVSIAAIAFIISLYARLTSRQKALKWGLPLVLGGALGNLNDRITRSQVIDFIDYRADWIMDLNVFVHRYVSNWAMTDHWPTFNVADIAICVGVGLMAIDMFSHRPKRAVQAPPAPSDSIPSGSVHPGSVHPGSGVAMSATAPLGTALATPTPSEPAGPDAPPAIG